MLWGRHGVIHGVVGRDAMKKTGCKGQTLNLCKVDMQKYLTRTLHFLFCLFFYDILR